MAFKFVLLIINIKLIIAQSEPNFKCIINNECYCSTQTQITCNSSLTDLTLKKVFQTIKDDHKFNTITIENSDLVKLPNNAFGNVSLIQLYF
jgi:hypothetical protein